MFEDQRDRMRDPRIRRLLLGVLSCFAVWVAVLLGLKASGLSSGSPNERILAVALAVLPIVGIALFFVLVHRQADEVERAIHATAAATGFVCMVMVATFALHLEAFEVSLGIDTRVIWASGLVGWLVGLGRAWVRHR